MNSKVESHLKYQGFNIFSILLSSFLLLAGCGGGSSFGPDYTLFDTDTNRALQYTLESKVLELGTPGAAALVVRVDGARWVGTTGVAAAADLDSVPYSGWKGTPFDWKMHFRIGSVTKSFTATLLLLLEEEGLLRLTDTIDDHLPGLIPDSREIELYRLLNMTSGLIDYTYHIPSPFNGSDIVYSPVDLVQAAVDAGGTAFEPGDQWHYSNTNYIVLGMIAEQVTGENYRDLIRERIIIPMGLIDTRVPAEADTALPAPFARGYYSDLEWIDMTGNNVSWAWSAGNIISTLEDLFIWIDVVLSGELLSLQSYQKMFNFIPTGSADLEYGLGIAKKTLPEGIATGHSGSLPGYETALYRLNDHYFIISSNGNTPSKAIKINSADEIFHELADVIF